MSAAIGDKPDAPATVEDKLIAVAMLRDRGAARTLKGVERQEAVDFICAQQYLYWVNVAKLGEERNWYIETYMAIVLVSMWDDEYFQQRIDDPVRVKQIDGGELQPNGNPGPYKIESPEAYNEIVKEFRAFMESLKERREGLVEERHNRLQKRRTEREANKAPVDKEPRELSKEFTKPITFKFVDENDKPIDGDFTLHQYKKGRYFGNWHRYLPLNRDGEIVIKEFPPKFEFGGSSKDDFYHYWIRSADLDPTKTTFLHRCTPSGAMKFEITSFPKKHYASLVVEYHKKADDRSHKVVKGIGIFPDDPEHVIGGLEPGEYFIAIKFHYEDTNPVFKSPAFKIGLKKYTTLSKIEITESAIDSTR